MGPPTIRMIRASASAISAATHWPTPQAIPERGYEPDGGSGCEAVDDVVLAALEDGAAAEEADAGDDALNGAADGIGVIVTGGSEADHDECDERCAKSDERVCAHPGRLPPHFPIEPDAASDEGGSEQPQCDFHRIGRHGEHGQDCFTSRGAGGGRNARE